jgi:hypothetical protein
MVMVCSVWSGPGESGDVGDATERGGEGTSPDDVIEVVISSVMPEVAVPLGYDRVILGGMKTAVSLPDATFARAERAAKELRMTRSELYARAVEKYLDAAEQESITARLNAAIARGGDDEELTAEVTAASRRALSVDGEDW